MLIILQNFGYFSGKTTFCYGNGNKTTFKSQDMSKINVLYNSCPQKICNIYCLTGSLLRNSILGQTVGMCPLIDYVLGISNQKST